MGQRTSPVPRVEEGTSRATVWRSAIRTYCHMTRGRASSRGLVINTPKKFQQGVEKADTKAKPQSMNATDLDSLAIEVAENEGWPVNPDNALPKSASHQSRVCCVEPRIHANERWKY